MFLSVLLRQQYVDVYWARQMRSTSLVLVLALPECRRSLTRWMSTLLLDLVAQGVGR